MRCLRIFLGAWAVVMIFRASSVGGTWLPVSFTTWLILAEWVTLFAFGYLLVAMPRSTSTALRPPPTARQINLVVWILALAVIVGAALVIFDFAILRQYGFNLSGTTIRSTELYEVAQGLVSSSPVSGLGRLAIPCLLPLIVLTVSNYGVITRRNKVVLAMMTPVILYEQIAFEGGRTMLVTAFLIAIIAYLISRQWPNRRSFSLKVLPIVRVTIIGILILNFVGYIFVTRIMERGDFFWSAYWTFVSEFDISVGPDTVARFEGIFGSIWFSLSMLWLYITQGVNELDLLLSQGALQQAFGSYQLPQLPHIGNLVFNADWSYNVYVELPNVGTYFTFFGANYVDFGWWIGLASGFVLGAFCALAIKRFAGGSLSGLAIAAPMIFLMALFSPILSLGSTIIPAIACSLIAGAILRASTAASSSRTAVAGQVSGHYHRVSGIR